MATNGQHRATNTALDGMYCALGRFSWRLSRYRNATAALTKAALRAKSLKGERVGNIRYGYQLAVDGKTLEPCEAEQGVLSVIMELRLTGYSLREISAELNGRGLTTRRGTPWRHEYVANLVSRVL